MLIDRLFRIVIVVIVIIAAATPWAAATILITPGHPHLSSRRRESELPTPVIN